VNVARPQGAAAFSQFVVKVHSRCNLACDHCYVYEHPDQSWRSRPVVMSESTMRAAAHRIGRHAATHALPVVHVVLHGGEPLLAGRPRIAALAGFFRETMPAGTEVRFGMQTNGILLDEAWCEVLVTEGIRVGVSIDGDQAANDRHRRYLNGRGSYAEVVAAIRLLGQPRHRAAFAGLLCTIDVHNDPVATYEALLALDPPTIDFLLPHATWDHPPLRPGPDATPYAGWLLAIHERWQRDGRPVPIRTFDALHNLAAGGGTLTEALGLDDVDLMVIETDGAIEQVDSLKTAYDGAPATGYRVQDHDIDEAARHPGFAARRGGRRQLCATCRACPVVDLCGGGMYAHRYRSGTGFDNPSVYCADLLRLAGDVRERQGRPGPGPAVHTLAGDLFDALARGGGSPEAIAALGDAQRSLRRSRLAAAVNHASAPQARAAWEALCDLDDVAPDAVDRVVGQPFVGIALERLASDPRALAYLSGAALAAAVIGRRSLRAEVATVEAGLVLPSLGVVRPPTGDRVVIEVDQSGVLALDGRVLDLDGPEDDRRWLPLRTLRIGDAPLVLDDLDPFRGCFGRPAADRLDDGRFEEWRTATQLAGKAIERDLAVHRPAIAALRSVTPLAAGQDDASGTHRLAYGAIGIAAPADPGRFTDVLTEAVVHEIQHVKMGSVLDLFELLDPRDERRFPVGWRADPRPLEGVLQGAYAHLAVTELWRIRAEYAPGNAAERTATITHARLQRQTGEAIDLLLGSGSLTALGQRWIEQMRETVVCGTSA
jgi:uncharacterized protein